MWGVELKHLESNIIVHDQNIVEVGANVAKFCVARGMTCTSSCWSKGPGSMNDLCPQSCILAGAVHTLFENY